MSDVSSDRPCKERGVELKFVKSSKTGKLLPLERVTCYWLSTEGDAGEEELVAVPREAWLSHFKTCTKPERFSSKGRRKKNVD